MRHAAVLQQLAHVPGHELGQPDVLGREVRTPETAEDQSTHAATVHHHRQAKVVAPALASLDGGACVLLAQDGLAAAVGFGGGRLAPSQVGLLGSTSPKRQGVGGFELPSVLVVQIERHHVEDEDRA